MNYDRVSPVIEATEENAPFRLKNILVPTDFSEASLLAVEHAQGLAALFGAEMHIVHVVPTLVPPEAATAVEDLRRQAMEMFQRFTEEANLDWPKEKMHVFYGDLLDELNTFIADHAIDLVVIGSSVREGASRLLLGSMAEYIFRGLRAPVLAMGPQVTESLSPSRPIRHMVLCEALVPESECAMRYGCALAENTGAAVSVVHTLPISLKDSPRALKFQRMFEEELRTGATGPELFERANYVVTFGDTASEVVRVAKSVHADLIVLGAKPAEMWQTHLGRGTAFRIVGSAHCPILSVCNCCDPKARGGKSCTVQRQKQ